MKRVQTYLTDMQKKKLKLKALDAAAGLWKDRTDLPDFKMLRDSFNRKFDK